MHDGACKDSVTLVPMPLVPDHYVRQISSLCEIHAQQTVSVFEQDYALEFYTGAGRGQKLSSKP